MSKTNDQLLKDYLAAGGKIKKGPVGGYESILDFRYRIKDDSASTLGSGNFKKVYLAFTDPYCKKRI